MESAKRIVFTVCSICLINFTQAIFGGGGCVRCELPPSSYPAISPPIPPPPIPRTLYDARSPQYANTPYGALSNVQGQETYLPQADYRPPQQIVYGQPQVILYRSRNFDLPTSCLAKNSMKLQSIKLIYSAQGPVPPLLPQEMALTPSSALPPVTVAYQQDQEPTFDVTPETRLSTESRNLENGRKQVALDDPTLQVDKELIEIYKKLLKIKGKKRKLQFAAQKYDKNGTDDDPKCNDASMRSAITENIDSNPATAKRLIHIALKQKVSGNVDVICSSGSFSYLVNTDLYCEVETADITCLAFRQATESN